MTLLLNYFLCTYIVSKSGKYDKGYGINSLIVSITNLIATKLQLSPNIYCHGCQCYGIHSFECSFIICNELIPNS